MACDGYAAVVGPRTTRRRSNRDHLISLMVSFNQVVEPREACEAESNPSAKEKGVNDGLNFGQGQNRKIVNLRFPFFESC